MIAFILLSSAFALAAAQRAEYPTYPYIESCPEPYGLQVYPHPESCHSFFKCANGTLTFETCENGLLFDGVHGDIFNHCSYHWAANCEGRTVELQPVNQGICEFEFGIYSRGACETSFAKCEYAEPTYYPCPEGLAYDERIHGCNWPDLMECNSEQIVGFQCPDYIPPEELASKFLNPRFPVERCGDSYYVCVSGQPRRAYCADYHRFNSATLSCDEPQYIEEC